MPTVRPIWRFSVIIAPTLMLPTILLDTAIPNSYSFSAVSFAKTKALSVRPAVLLVVDLVLTSLVAEALGVSSYYCFVFYDNFFCYFAI